MSEEFYESPREALLQYAKETIDNPYIQWVLQNSGASIVRGYFVWPVETEEDESIYYAINPEADIVCELEYHGQLPPGGIHITSEEDAFWILDDLQDFVETALTKNTFNDSLFPSEARYTLGPTGFLHSLS